MNTDRLNQHIMTVLSQLSLNTVIDEDNDLIIELLFGDQVISNTMIASEEIKRMVDTPDDDPQQCN